MTRLRGAPASRRRARGRSRTAAAAGAAAAAAAALAFVLLAFGGERAGLRFEVVDAGAGRVVYARAVAVGEQVELAHVHSVHRRPVVEVFSVPDGSGLALEELLFDATGANLPSGPERVGDAATTFVAEDGGYRVQHHGRLLETVPLRVGGPEVDHTLSFDDGERLRLLDVASWGAHVELRVSDHR